MSWLCPLQLDSVPAAVKGFSRMGLKKKKSKMKFYCKEYSTITKNKNKKRHEHVFSQWAQGNRSNKIQFPEFYQECLFFCVGDWLVI